MRRVAFALLFALLIPVLVGAQEAVDATAEPEAFPGQATYDTLSL